MTRYVTFRFDDGFIDGVRKAAAALEPDHATIFIVTGSADTAARPAVEHLFKNSNLGTVDEWQCLSLLGHDIQPHSVSHANFATLDAEQQRVEIVDSLAVIRGIHAGPYIFGFPYNVISQLDLASLGLAAAGFATESSDQNIMFNNLNVDVDLYRLRSWAVRERHFDKVCHELQRLPDQSWTILAFHSLDGEGHEPWTSGAFSQLVDFARSAPFQIITIRDAIEMLIGKRQGAQRREIRVSVPYKTLGM